MARKMPQWPTQWSSTKEKECVSKKGSSDVDRADDCEVDVGSATHMLPRAHHPPGNISVSMAGPPWGWSWRWKLIANRLQCYSFWQNQPVSILDMLSSLLASFRLKVHPTTFWFLFCLSTRRESADDMGDDIFLFPLTTVIYHRKSTEISSEPLTIPNDAYIASWGQTCCFYLHVALWAWWQLSFLLTINSGCLGMALSTCAFQLERVSLLGSDHCETKKRKFLDLQRGGSVSSF